MVTGARVAVESSAERRRVRGRPELVPAQEQLLRLQRSAGNAAVARELARRSAVQRMAIAHAGKDYETTTMSDSELGQLIATLPGPDLYRAALGASRNEADVLIGRLHAAPRRTGYVRALTVLKAQRFAARYLAAVPPNLLDRDHLSTRIEQLVALGTPVEDYTSDVFARPQVAQRLTAISTSLTPDALGPAARRVCDMLLFTSLVATVGEGAAARSMMVLTPDALVRVLDPAKLGGGAPLPAADVGAPKVGEKPDPRRLILQDMLRINAMSLDGPLGGAVAGSALFKAILQSNVIDVVLLANTQHEEQHYMSSCSIASRDQEVLSRIGSLAGLVVLGKLVANRFLHDLGAQENALTGRASTQGPNLFVHAASQASRTLAELGEIEFAALELVYGGVRDVNAYGTLVARWGKVMQRLSSVLQVPSQGVRSGSDSVAVLSEKIIPGQWVLSAFAMAVPVLVQAGFSGDFAAHLQGRVRPPSAQAFSTALGQQGMPTTGGASVDLGQRTKTDWAAAMPKLWSETLNRGATPFSIPGHAVVMKAVRSRGAQVFLLGDPKGSSFDEYTLDEMAAYLSKQEIDMPFDPFA
jgi:hypothetical protein